MKARGLYHAVLYVRDLDASRHFYGDVLGFKEISDAANMPFRAAAFIGADHRTHHELLLIEVGDQAAPIPSGRRVGLYHLGVKVGDSMDELREARDALQAAGIRIEGASDHTATWSLYLRDPDGNEIELYCDNPDVDWKTDPSVVMAPIKPLEL